MLILNNPHNPTGKLYSRADLERIAELVRAHSNVIVVADEVYEWIVYPDAGNKMIRFGMFNLFVHILSFVSESAGHVRTNDYDR